MAAPRNISTAQVWREYQLGIKIQKIAENFGCHRNTIARHIKRYKTGAYSPSARTSEIEMSPKTTPRQG